MAGKTQTLRVKRKLIGASIIFLGGLGFVAMGINGPNWFLLIIGGLIALAGLAIIGLSRVTLGPTELVQHAPVSPKANVHIAKSAITGTHTAPFGSVTQVVVDTTTGEVVLMGLSSNTKEQGVDYAMTIAQWAGVSYDPAEYPDRGPQRRPKV